MVSREPGGARLRCDLRDHMARVVYYRGWVERGFEAWITGWLRPGDTFVDVGANIGHLVAAATRSVGPAGRVLAFEPAPVTFARLSAAFPRRRFPQVQLFDSAVAEGSGSATLFEGEGSWAYQTYRSSTHGGPGMTAAATVTSVSLDDVLDEVLGEAPVRLLKVDVEGGEQAVVQGARSFLGSGRCDAVAVELNPEALGRAGSSVRELVASLDDLGFTAHRCRPAGTLEPWSPVVVTAEFADAVFLRRSPRRP